MKLSIKINRRNLKVESGKTILQAAEQTGIHIPTLCYYEGLPHQTSCMVCMVQEMKSGKLVPACSMQISEGMEIETDNDAVLASRRTALELLLSEHTGDCEGPCQRACPAHMDIPGMLQMIAAGQNRKALIRVKARIALPAVLGYICPAPCEKICRRSQLDFSIPVCRLKLFAAEKDLESGAPFLSKILPDSGRRAAIVGAGPAGLSAAYYLRQQGHACVIYDANHAPGGTLLQIEETRLPKKVLDAEIEILRRTGIRFEMNHHIESPAELQNRYDAVIIACGANTDLSNFGASLIMSASGVQADARTFETELPGIFACGGAVRPLKMAVTAGAQGRLAAISADQYLRGQTIAGEPQRFQFKTGRLTEAEIEDYQNRFGPLKDVRIESDEDARRISAFCLSCDCKKPDQCKLRTYSEAYEAKANQYHSDSRHALEQVNSHSDILYEPGKCIRCGICVRITEQEKEPFGLTYIGRGFDVKVGVPLNRNLQEGLQKTALKVAEACPTGAITLKNAKLKMQN